MIYIIYDKVIAMYRTNIRLIDMHHRDSIVLQFLRDNAQQNKVKTNSNAIAVAVGCHPQTAKAILKRLLSSGHIEIIEKTYRGGFTYKV